MDGLDGEFLESQDHEDGSQESGSGQQSELEEEYVESDAVRFENMLALLRANDPTFTRLRFVVEMSDREREREGEIERGRERERERE